MLLVVKIIVHYCCKRVCHTRKMLKETKSEETMGFFATVLSLVTFQVGGGRSPLPPPPTAAPLMGLGLGFKTFFGFWPSSSFN